MLEMRKGKIKMTSISKTVGKHAVIYGAKSASFVSIRGANGTFSFSKKELRKARKEALADLEIINAALALSKPRGYETLAGANKK